jgi:hypothetical protein
MSNSYMKSAYFQTQVNQANQIKECYPCGSRCNQIVTYNLPTDLTLSSLTVTGKATILGLIDPTGLEFTPVTTNPGGVQANTIWVNSTDANNLYFGASPLTGGGGGGVNSVTAGTNISTSGTVTDPIINFAPGGTMNMNGAQLTSISTMSVSSISNVSLIDNSSGSNISLTMPSTIVKVESAGMVSITTTDYDTDVILRLENAGGKGGEIIASELGSYMAVQAQGGYGLVVESAQGNVDVITSQPDTTLTAWVNNGTASLIMTDTANVGSIDLNTTGGSINLNSGSQVNVSCSDFNVGPSNQATNIQSGTSIDLAAASGASLISMNSSGVNIATANSDTTLTASVNGTAQITLTDVAGVGSITMTPNSGIVEIVADSLTLAFPTVRFSDPTSANTVNWAMSDLGAGRPILTADGGHLIGATIGANSGFSIGHDTGASVNCAFGNDGLPTRISHSQTALATDYIQLEAGGVGGKATIVETESITLTTPSVLLGGITTYDTASGVEATVQADVNNLDQVLTNNAYVPMTAYDRGISFTINPSPTLAFDTNAFTGGSLFRWRYSGQFAPSGLNVRSRYCGALRFQVDVNIASRLWDNPDTIIWWVELNDITNGQVYQAIDFGTTGDRHGYITTSQINPTNGEICHSVSFSSIFDLDTSVTGQPTPDDGDNCSFFVYGWGNITSTTGRANVSVSIRPMRTLV